MENSQMNGCTGEEQDNGSQVDGEKMARQGKWYLSKIMIKTILLTCLKCGYSPVHPCKP
jgi:hypothetical protein